MLLLSLLLFTALDLSDAVGQPLIVHGSSCGVLTPIASVDEFTPGSTVLVGCAAITNRDMLNDFIQEQQAQTPSKYNAT